MPAGLCILFTMLLLFALGKCKRAVPACNNLLENKIPDSLLTL